MARDEKLIKELPVEERHRVTVNRLEQKTLITDAVEKYRRVYAAIMECFAALPFWRAVFLLGLYGRRKNEILRLRWEDIGLEDGVYIIRGSHSKIKQDLAFPLPDEVRRALRELSPRRASGWVFPNPATGRPYIDIRRYVAMIREASGWEGFGFHRMRNLTSSALYAAGVDASHLSSLLGHTNPQTLKQYLTMQRIESGKIAEEGARALLDFKLSKTDGDSPSVEHPGTSRPERGRPP
jgi:integrase